MTQRETICLNREKLKHLDPERYPSLHYLSRKTKVLLHLDCIMEHMLAYSVPVWPPHNRRYYLFSTDHLQKWARETRNIKTSTKTWQGHTMLLEVTGLIKIIRVTGPSSDPFLNSLYFKAVERSKANRWKKRIISESLWTVPGYTDTLLSAADDIAKEYLDSRVNLSHLSKDDVIAISGQETANKLYHDQRVVSEETKTVQDCITRVIRASIDEKGYATKAEIKERLESTLAEELHFTFPDPDHEHEWTTADLDERDREKRYHNEVKKAMERFRFCCNQCGCVFRSATKQQCERFGLPIHSWVIVPKEQG